MNPIVVHEEKCVGCALCVKDCPNACLYLENGKARTEDQGCIECGHCYAICPEGAVSMTGYSREEEPVIPMTRLSSDTLLGAMKSRRSIRHFKKQPVEEEKIRKILEAGRYAPTGANAQNVSYTILGSRQRAAEDICVRLFRQGQKLASPFAGFLKRVEITDDFFFKGAPW